MTLLHSIDHLSPSSLAKFRAQPAAWVVHYLYGIRDESGPRAQRGKAVEAGVQVGLADPDASLVKCTDAAQTNFELNMQGEISDEIESERMNICRMVEQALPLIRPLGRPDGYQLKIEYWMPNVPVPIIGYLDWQWPGLVVDLKTTLRMPSGMRPDHQAQAALYSAAQKRPAALLYVTPTKSKLVRLTQEEVHAGMNDLHRSARSLIRALEVFRDPKDMMLAYPVDLDHYIWSERSREKYLEVAG